MDSFKEVVKNTQSELMEILWKGNSIYDGFGTSTYWYVKILRELGIKVQFESLQGKTKEHQKLLKNNPKVSDEAIRITHASGGNKANEIIYTCYDAYKIPNELVGICNNSFEVWVPSEFCKDAFHISGVDRYLEIIPHGIDPKIFNPEKKPLFKFKKFTFITEFAHNCFKENPQTLIWAFLEEFRNLPAQLLIHTSEESKQSLITNLLTFFPLELIKKKLKFHTEKLSFKDMGKLYTSAHAYASCPCGEAFGMPQLEAQACGLPVVTTGAGGQIEFLKEKSLLINVHRVAPEWSLLPVPDPVDVRIALQVLYENYPYFKSRAIRFSKDIRKDWTWEQACKKLINRLEELKNVQRIS